jgi:hypothetical protein
VASASDPSHRDPDASSRPPRTSSVIYDGPTGKMELAHVPISRRDTEAGIGLSLSCPVPTNTASGVNGILAPVEQNLHSSVAEMDPECVHGPRSDKESLPSTFFPGANATLDGKSLVHNDDIDIEAEGVSNQPRTGETI